MNDEVQHQEPIEPTEAQETILRGYERATNREHEEPPPVDQPTALTHEQASELLAQVARIPDLEKQLRDSGGRYGSLKQTIEQLQQRIERAPVVDGAPVDVEELMKEIQDEENGYPELAALLKPAFAKLASRGGIDSAAIEQMVEARMQETVKKETATLEATLEELHPGWKEKVGSAAFNDWTNTLSSLEARRINNSRDPYYIAEKLEQFKSFEAKETPPSNKRLENAIPPTGGIKPAPKGEGDSRAQIRAAYDRVRGARL